MSTQPLDDNEAALVRQVVNACENAIKEAVTQPSRAIGLAKSFGAALTSLHLIQSEVAKGEKGAAAVTANADALTRHALTDILKVATEPRLGFAALAAVDRVAPKVIDIGAAPSPAARLKTKADGVLPLFSEISRAYIDMRIDRDSENHPDIGILRLRRQTFLDVAGDRRPDQYFPSDLQSYVNRMQCWPANVTKRGGFAGKTTLEILEANRKLTLKPLAHKTLKDGYVANIRTMMNFGTQDHDYHDPFAKVRLTYPKILRPSIPREGVSNTVTNRVFQVGIAHGMFDEAMLPPLAKLSSRRLGLLTFLCGEDIRERDGVWIAQTAGIVEVANEETNEKEWKRVPVKTDESMPFFVLHNFLAEIGFVDFMRAQPGFIFTALHEHPKPDKYASKTLQNHFKRCGAKRGEVFHSLRGDGIDGMRESNVESRERRLQAGHELGTDTHDQYGFRALSGMSSPCQSPVTGRHRLVGVQRARFRGDGETPAHPRTPPQAGELT